MSKEQEMQERMQEMQQMQQHLEQLQEQRQMVEQQLEDLAMSSNGLEEFEKLSKGDEVLFPVSNGIFAKATLQNPQKLLVNIGAQAIVDKTPEQAKKILQDQLTELQELHQKIVGRLQAFMVQAQALDQQLQGMAK
jgi:prefoldin alpha subunit|tara:strand:- start:579 stop:986 length:408 start_codon:yes stop_codon:yes gene_type:complete